jgi:SAM-dependent methyltransferase
MNVYKNTEVAREFNVSDPTVINWIQGSISKKNNLQLFEVKKKLKIIKSEHNKSELYRLAESGQVHKNRIQKSEVVVSPELYQILSTTQVIELVNELKTNYQIPLKFTYLNGGAEIWDRHVNEGLKNGTYIVSIITDELMSQSFEFIINQIAKFKKVNVVDIGVGNAYPSKNLLMELAKKEILNKYVSIDISADLASIANKNVKEWLPNVELLSFNVDFEKQDLTEILFEIKNNDIINLIFFVGGTYGNLEDREKFLKIIRDSLDGDDIVVITNKLSHIKSYSELGHLDSLFESLLWIPKLLNIDVENCEIVKRFEPSLDSRAIFLVLDKDYNFQFDVKGVIKNVQLLKGEEIRLWKHHMSSIDEVIEESRRANLEVTHFTQNRKNMLFICNVKN